MRFWGRLTEALVSLSLNCDISNIPQTTTGLAYELNISFEHDKTRRSGYDQMPQHLAVALLLDCQHVMLFSLVSNSLISLGKTESLIPQ